MNTIKIKEVKKEDIELNGREIGLNDRDLARDLAKSTLVDTTLRKSGENGY